MGFAKIAAGAPSSTRAMAKHLMNSTLRPEENRLAAYYATGLVATTDQRMPLTKREVRNAIHAVDWMVGNVKPDIVRLAEYALSQDAIMTEGEIEKRLTNDLERAIAVADGGDTLPPNVRALHGLPAPEPVRPYLRDLTITELHRRLDSLQDQWSEALQAADARIDNREFPEDANAPLAIVRPDLHPLVAMGLGIGSERKLSNDQVEALLAGRRADGKLIEGKRYATERRLPVNPRTGEVRYSTPIGSFDFSTSADKSVSIAWAFAGAVEQAKIFNAHVEASRDAVGYMAERVGQARLGHGGEDGFELGHVAWLEFTHHTARQTMFTVEKGEIVARSGGAPGDPDLHTHHLMPNVVFTETGRVGSLDTEAVTGFILEAGSVYQMRLAHYLAEHGFPVELDPKTGATRMPDIPNDVRSLFSKRTAIGELIARKMTNERGENWDALSQDQREARMKSATQSLDQKVKGGKDDKVDLDDWKRQAKEFCNWEAPEAFVRKVYTVELSPEMKHRLAYETALPMLENTFEHKSVVKHFDLRIAAARGMIAVGGGDRTDVDAITAHMRKHGVRQYGERTGLVWGVESGKRYVTVTTGLHEAQEAEFIRLARAASVDLGGAIQSPLLEKHAKKSGLDFTTIHGRAQRFTMERLGTGGRFSVAIGAAGSGKSAMLRPLVAAWKEQGREIYGASLAWRQADELISSGIDRRNVFAFSVMIEAAETGNLKLTKNSVVAVDEFGMLGTRQGLELLRLQQRHGFSIVALGDDRQCASPSAGAIIDLTRRALGAEQIPEIITTVRQQSEREKIIAGLFRDGRAAEALDMKRADGTAELASGGYDGTVARVASLYRERLQETGHAPTIAAPTNQDAHRISEAVRLQRREMGSLGNDLMTIRATDGERNYIMPLAKGDRVRLFSSTAAEIEGNKGRNIGRNGSVLEVIDADKRGITLQAKSGKIGKVTWETLETKGRIKLAYGDAMTIHTAQGITSREHILALPGGSQAIDGKSGYSGNTRHRVKSYLVTNDNAEREAVRKSRPLNDTREITLDDKWANVARVLAYQPEKDTATALLDRIRVAKRGGVKEFQRVMPDITKAHQPAREATGRVVERRMIERLVAGIGLGGQQQPRDVGRDVVGLSR